MSRHPIIRHIALFRWKEESRLDPAMVSQELTTIAARTAAIKFDAGEALGLGQPSFDFAVVADFASVEDYLAYREDPGHSAYVRDVLRPAADQVSAIQLTVSQE